MTVKVKVLKDSLHPESLNNPLSRLVTLQVEYPRFIHSEIMTHRSLSKNFSSSRAIPFLKKLQQIKDDVAMPVRFGGNQSGMVMNESVDQEHAELIWNTAFFETANRAKQLHEIGVHKTLPNRLLEPFSYITGVITGEIEGWLNFLRLRLSSDADENIQELAKAVYKAIKGSLASVNEWHLPYIDYDEHHLPIETQIAMSVARCARVSYMNHGKTERSVDDDITLYERLKNSGHFSCFEHINHFKKTDRATNFRFWEQHRVEVDNITKNEEGLKELYFELF
jgi:thymidylate synthase ThyX